MPVKHSTPGGVLNKTDGTTAPGVGDDSADGFSKTSLWIHATVSPVEVYVCVDNTAGAAIWVKTTLTIDELGSMAVQNANAVAITGGTINGTTIGGTTAAAITGTTINGTTFDTNVAAAGVTLAGTTLAADGTDADIDITITPKGAGSVVQSKVDINGGSVDGTIIGANSAAAATVTSLTTSLARVVGVTPIVTGSTGGTTAAAATHHVVEFTGTTTHAYTLPALANGREFRLCNTSTGAVTINRTGADTFSTGGTSVVLAAGDSCIIVGSSNTWMVF